MRKKFARRAVAFVAGAVGLVAGAICLAQEKAGVAGVRDVPEMDVNHFKDVAAHHPAGEALLGYFGPEAKPAAGDFRSTGLSRKDYLPLIAGNVDFWKHFQDGDGAIVDPYEHKERQYSTPAFALAAAALVKEAGREDLVDARNRAMSWAVKCLAEHKAADGHADFYIPMLMHARRLMAETAPKTLLATWDQELSSIVPEKAYHDPNGGGNWNLVNVSGELLRRKDGLVAPEQAAAQWAYVERSLERQRRRFTKFGMYEDPNAPLAYDVFPRLWLEDALADGAYDRGKLKDELDRFLALGGLSGMLLMSPSGEWACGGRSAQHQWNEAANAEIAEIEAARWTKAGRADVAGAFKRVAHLALTSMKRWQRPSGEMWIVKNFADPARRFGFEGYSFNSQYNLLPMGMLAIAYERADESVAEFPTPGERGSYVFDLREVFHHVVAAAGGTYVEIDTGADPAYGSTGLQRVHAAGVALSPVTDTPGRASHLGPVDEKGRGALSTGIEWKVGDGWRGLSSYGVRPHAPAGKTVPAGDDLYVKSVDLKVTERSAERVAFTLKYELGGEAARDVEEQYVVSAAGVEGTTRLPGGDDPGALRAVFPALVNDGSRDTDVVIDGATVTVTRRGAPAYSLPHKGEGPRAGGRAAWTVTEPTGVKLERTGPLLVTHNGYVQAVAGALPDGTREVRWKLAIDSGAAGGSGGAR